MYKLSKSSGSGSTKWTNSIYFEINTPKTYASYLLLTDSLRMQDEDFLNKFGEKMKRIQFSRDLLTNKKEEFGKLTCEYCNATDLIIELEGMKVSPVVMATIDHVIPISKGGAIYDVKNLVVACGDCNHRKSNKDLETFLYK